jgi:hypothetical protein
MLKNDELTTHEGSRRASAYCMAHDALPLAQRGPQQGESRSPLKTPCEKIEPLKNAVRLRRAQASSSTTRPRQQWTWSWSATTLSVSLRSLYSLSAVGKPPGR